MALFAQFAQLADTLAETASRLKKRAAIADSLITVRAQDSAAEAGLFAQYLAGMPFAEADARKVNVGGAQLSRAVKEITQATDAQVTAAYRRHGDFGAAAQDLYVAAGMQTQGGLTIAGVAASLAAMAEAKTTAQRGVALNTLLREASAVEAKYLIKLLLGDMRIGVKQSLVEEAIAASAACDVAAVRHAVMLEADLARATEMAFAGTLHEARMRLFHPLGFMLASPVETTEEAVERFASVEEKDVAPTHIQAHIQAQIEDKYDGMRVQLHCGQDGRVALYSRNREDVTESYPELAEAFAQVTEPLILDGEVLAWDVAQQRAMPFAVLSPRIGRKRVDNSVRSGTPVVFMAFDVLFAAGRLQLEETLLQRRAVLESIAERWVEKAQSPLVLPLTADTDLFAAATEDARVQRLHVAPVNLAYTADDLDRLYAAARERGNEGVMIKAAESLYQPGRRGLAWLKLKRALETLDVVITGAEYGHGKRAQLLSDYTFAVRGPQGELLNVGKAYSGVTDAEIAELTAWLKANTLEEQGHFRTVKPERVLEVAFNNVMRSDRHASGFALRFPRIVRVRDDKPVYEIDTLERVEAIYESQPDKPQSQAEVSSE